MFVRTCQERDKKTDKDGKNDGVIWVEHVFFWVCLSGERRRGSDVLAPAKRMEKRDEKR